MARPVWIEEFAESSYQLFINHDPAAHLPFDAWGLHPLYNDLWLQKLYELVVELEGKEVKAEKIISCFPNISSTRFNMLMFMIHYQTSGLDKPEIITKIMNFFYDSMKLRCKEDIFATKKNLSLNNQELDCLLEKREINSTSLEESREVGKILVALASLTHGLYNDWCTDFNYEVEGPYYKDGDMILVRLFPNCCPKEIWPELSLNRKNFSIITTYTDMMANISFVGCHITYTANAVEKLRGYSIEVDSKRVSGPEELIKLRNELMPIAAEQFEKFMKMDFEEQKVKYLFQEGYQFAELFKLAGMNWMPSKEMIERVKGKKLIDDVFPSYDMTFDEYKEKFGINKLTKAYELV